MVINSCLSAMGVCALPFIEHPHKEFVWEYKKTPLDEENYRRANIKEAMVAHKALWQGIVKLMTQTGKPWTMDQALQYHTTTKKDWVKFLEMGP